MNESLAERLAAARGSSDPDLLVALGCDLSDDDEHIDAAWCFRAAVDLGEKWAAFNLGNELVALGRDRDAVTAYEQALAAGEDDAWLNLGAVLHDLGDLAGALRAHERGQASGDVNAGMARAFLLREIDERDAAVAVVDELAAAGSFYADAVAACWLYDRTLDPGLESRLRAGAEHFPGARVDLADILRRSDRVGEAILVLQRGVDLNESEVCLPLGNIYADDLDDPAAAEVAYRAGLATGNTYCHNNLGTLFEDQDRLDDARHQYERGAAAGDALAARALAELDDEDEDGA